MTYQLVMHTLETFGEKQQNINMIQKQAQVLVGVGPSRPLRGTKGVPRKVV